MQKKSTNNAAFRNKMASKKNAKTALLGKTEATQHEESGFDYSGVIMATSFTVVGAVAAAFAIKKCAGKKQEQEDHFERIVWTVTRVASVHDRLEGEIIEDMGSSQASSNYVSKNKWII